jgi:hypothetical protein
VAASVASALAALVAVVAIFAIWANDQLLDTDSWVSASGKALESATVRDGVEDFISAEVIDLAGGAARTVGGIPAPLRAQLRAEAKKVSDQVLTSARFRAVWLRANRIAHRAVVGVLEEKGKAHGEGRVAIDLTPAVREAVGAVGGRLKALVKPDSARIEVLEAHELETARDVVRIVRRLPVPATLAAIALWALAGFLLRARRWRAFAAVGLSLVGAGALALLARAIAGHQVFHRLLSHGADRDAAEVAWHILTSLIVDLSVAAIALGALLALFGALLGPLEPGPAFRRWLGAFLATPRGMPAVLSVVVLAFVLLVLWAPLAVLDSPLAIALFALVIGGGMFDLGRSAKREPLANRQGGNREG